MGRFLGALVTLAALVALVILAWPQAVGLEDSWLVAQAVALRGATVVIALAAAIVFALLSLARPLRVLAGGLAGVLIVYCLAVTGILALRGAGSSTPDAAQEGDVTVLSWNTLGDEPGAQRIADVAVREGADVVMLPETSHETGLDVALAMREAGHPMWVHTVAFDQISKARSTTVLISPDLGEYDLLSSGENRGDNTSVLPSAVLEPTDGEGPRIVAVHAVAPMKTQMQNWRDDLAWLADQCATGSVIMAGDFNATIDHMFSHGVDGGDLGRCADAAVSGGSGAVGTWHTEWPALVGAPIDHVMATADWRVRAVHVVRDQDAAGSDHRPIVATLQPSEASAER